MSLLRYLLIISFFLQTAFAMSQFSDSITQKPYELLIKHQRHQKDSSMKNPENSPLPDDKINDFNGLEYFPVNKSYKVSAQVELSSDTTSFVIPTTTDRKPLYRKYGRASFTLEGHELELTIYQNVRLLNDPDYEDYLFIPFNDLTNGMETYGGGRYIDIRSSGDTSVTIDFNKAYNPYCAYNHKYSCPIPPDENSLKVQIRAGEKAFEQVKTDSTK